MADLTPHLRAITAELHRTTAPDSLDRSQMRVRLMLDLFYDLDDEGPHTAVADALTDLLHYAAEHGVDTDEALCHAEGMRALERREWGLDRLEEIR